MSFRTDDGYWAGATWVYQVVAEGSGVASHVYTVSPGVGNEFEILYGSVDNRAASARTSEVLIDDGANVLVPISTRENVNSGHFLGFPHSEPAITNAAAGAGVRWFLAGGMRLVATLVSMSAGDVSAFGLVCRLRGGLPDVTVSVGGTPTVTENRNEVF